MIVHKTNKSIETISDKPNSNFGGYDNVFVVDDNSDLGKKIRRYAPYFDFVLNNGELIDVTPIERPPSPPEQPSIEERVKATEEAINSLLGLQEG